MTDQSDLRQSSASMSIPQVANRPQHTVDRAYTVGRRDGLLFLSAVVAINAWALFPSSDESGNDVPLPDSIASALDMESVDGGGAGGSTPYSLARAELVDFMKTTPGGTATAPSPRAAAAPSSEAIAYPNLLNALSRVPVKAKLRVLLTLLVSEADPVKQADLQTKLQALLKLPDDVLLQVLQHPDLADFSKMLDAVFLGDTELWWIESQLDKIDIVPVTTTTDRIDVSGRPAYMFDSTAVAHNGDGGQASPALKSLAPSSAPPQGAMMKVSQVEEAGGFTTFAAPPTSNDVQVNEFSMSAPVVDVAPSAAPAPSPEPSPAPVASLASTNAEISHDAVETQPTTSPDVFDGGNRFEPGTTVSEPTIQNTTAPETATPSTASTPPPADDTANNSPSTPSDNGNEGGTSPGSEPS
jgi:hypothetical protein